MRFPLLVTWLLVVASAGAATAQTAENALAPADERRDAEALAAFRALVARNPGDLQARLWIARLHERMGNIDQAEPVYHSVLQEDPASLDAALGVARALLARREPEEAVDLLEPVVEGRPDNAAALEMLGRAHRLAGRTERAIGYFERAFVVEPSDEYRFRLESARLAHGHRIETRGFGEQFPSPTPDTRGGDVAVNYRLLERLRVIGRAQTQRKFSVTEQRAGGGVEWRWRPLTTIRAQVLVGAGNLVMPGGDVLGEVDHAIGAVTWSGAIRYFDFTGARTTFASPAVSFPATERLSVTLRYAVSWTETSATSRIQTGHTAQLRGTYRLRERLSLQGGYSAGVDDFETFAIDRIGDFRARTVHGGVRLDLRTLTSVIAGYDRQWRRHNGELGRVNVAVQQRF